MVVLLGVGEDNETQKLYCFERKAMGFLHLIICDICCSCLRRLSMAFMLNLGVSLRPSSCIHIQTFQLISFKKCLTNPELNIVKTFSFLQKIHMVDGKEDYVHNKNDN